MKTKFSAATIVAALIFTASCTLFQKKEPTDISVLAGKYELINISDTPTVNAWMPGDTIKSFFNTIRDTSHTFIHFESDSILLYEFPGKTDTTKYYADTAAKIVYVKQDGVFKTYRIIPQTDSVVNIADDSLFFVLKRL